MLNLHEGTRGLSESPALLPSQVEADVLGYPCVLFYCFSFLLPSSLHINLAIVGNVVKEERLLSL